FANESRSANFDAAAMATVASFRKLDDDALSRLKPLRIRVVVANAGDSEDTFVRQMQGVDRPRELFRSLNDIGPGERIAPGTRVKIVAD
ncbi:MAG TPA: metalloprotease, partial [Bauldia sp.]|nr:metalloprotease [Bauldia sp.]